MKERTGSLMTSLGPIVGGQGRFIGPWSPYNAVFEKGVLSDACGLGAAVAWGALNLRAPASRMKRPHEEP